MPDRREISDGLTSSFCRVARRSDHFRRIYCGTPGACVLPGPGVAPIAVAAIAFCLGIEALRAHPALARLREHVLTVRPETPVTAAPRAIQNPEAVPTLDELHQGL